MKLSIIICAYNEERTIRKVLVDIAMLQMQLEYEIIVVDDGSTDATPAAVRGAGVPVVYVRQPRNLGKGAAMRKGISLARGEFILIQDADLEYSPSDYPQLLEPLLSGQGVPL
jgi:glycosyltransferase involved in cell wall biosynthesis